MDNWTEREIALMKAGGGNQAVRAFLEKHGLADFDKLSTREKYDSPQGEMLRQTLRARVDGLPEPTVLPARKTAAVKPKRSGKVKMEGFGSSPPPADTNNRAKDLRRCLYVTVSVLLGAAIWKAVPRQ